MKHKRKIKKVVEAILIDDRKARNSDKYLYLEVVRRLNPGLLGVPFAIAITDAKIPCMETVRRSRQWLQAHDERLRADENVEAARELIEEECREFYGRGR